MLFLSFSLSLASCIILSIFQLQWTPVQGQQNNKSKNTRIDRTTPWKERGGIDFSNAKGVRSLICLQYAVRTGQGLMRMDRTGANAYGPTEMHTVGALRRSHRKVQREDKCIYHKNAFTRACTFFCASHSPLEQTKAGQATDCCCSSTNTTKKTHEDRGKQRRGQCVQCRCLIGDKQRKQSIVHSERPRGR